MKPRMNLVFCQPKRFFVWSASIKIDRLCNFPEYTTALFHTGASMK